MGWGEVEDGGSAGTTGQIQLAHSAFDKVGIKPGNLARRAIEAAGLIHRLQGDSEEVQVPEIISIPVVMEPAVIDQMVKNDPKMFLEIKQPDSFTHIIEPVKEDSDE